MREDSVEYKLVGSGASMQRDDEIEAVGMRVAMQYERDQGWEALDVAGENLGFDVRSMCWNEDGSLDGIRYVEVKARARSGEIRITANEWKKARRYEDDYWLHIVTDAGTKSPKLHRLQNPAVQFEMESGIFVTGYRIPEEHWRREVDKLLSRS